MQNDSIQKTIFVAVALCLVCSLFVSLFAVSLHDIRKENKRLDKVKNILIAGGLYDPSVDVQSVYENKVVPLLIELDTGQILNNEEYPDGIDVDTYDLKKMASDPTFGRSVDSAKDIANIRNRPKYIFVYKVMENDKLQRIILPIYGYGLWSTLYGFVSLGNDLQSIQGITFYEHGETPGLGGEVDNAKWKGLWPGKQAFDDDGQCRHIRNQRPGQSQKCKSKIPGRWPLGCDHHHAGIGQHAQILVGQRRIRSIFRHAKTRRCSWLK